jgi:hypothetical protein
MGSLHRIFAYGLGRGLECLAHWFAEELASPPNLDGTIASSSLSNHKLRLSVSLRSCERQLPTELMYSNDNIIRLLGEAFDEIK